MFTRPASPPKRRSRPARKLPRRRIGALAALCAATAGFAVVGGAAPAQAASSDPGLSFSSTEETGTFTVTDSNPALQNNHADRMTVINHQGTPISVYSLQNYTGSCSTYTATTDNQTFTINTANGWGPESVGIGITCGQWPGNLYGTPMAIHTTGPGGTSNTYQPYTRVLDVPNGTRDWGARTVTWDQNGGDNQRWYLKEVSVFPSAEYNWLLNNGATFTTGVGAYSLHAYKLISVMNNDYINARCLEAAGATPQIGATVETYPCDPNAKNQPNQLWISNRSINLPPGVREDIPISANPQVDANQPVGAAANPNALGSTVWYNAAMLTGANPTQFPALTVDGNTLLAANGDTLSMEPQIGGSRGYPEQSLWMKPILPPAPGGTSNVEVSNPCPGFTALVCGIFT